MINAGILDKDIAIIEKTEQYKTGEIVAILIETKQLLRKLSLKKQNNLYSKTIIIL